MKGYLVLENGEVFEGERIGYDKDVISEIVFNTGMAGYLKVFTDPSYCGQGVVMTYPLIGNYGVIPEDAESEKMWVDAIFIHELAPLASNFRTQMNLNEYLIKNEIPGLQGINTRKLTKLLRDYGTMKGMLTSDISNIDEIIEKIKEHINTTQVEIVSPKEISTIGKGDINIALLDFGNKRNIVRCLLKRNCKITLFPANTKAEEIINGNFDGIVLSNGPGDPVDCKDAIENIKELYNTDIPILGICLGHQLLGIATGAKTAKLKYGHRGPNHPVKNIEKDRVHITSQNHGYYILEDTIDPNIAKVSHINLNDNTVEGLKYIGKDIVTVQFHPEAWPGPEDTEYIFDDFIKAIERRMKNA